MLMMEIIVKERERLVSINASNYYQRRLGFLEGHLCLAQRKCKQARICLEHFKQKCKSETLAQRLRLQGFEHDYISALTKKNRLERDLTDTLAFSKSMN
jgi:hypothetical protein